jgi:tetratricopeptide (TPR) repeat protein
VIGRVVDRFRIVGRLGQGGMGSVWKAEDTLLGRPVALKILANEWTHSSDARARFLREARAASSLDHPCVATVFGAGESGAEVFIALALIDGETVSDLAAREPFAWPDAVRMALAVAEALAHAHARGVIHRDVSGRNIMIDRDGRVFVLDFGLARMVDRTRLTTTPTAMGTAAYMAPEVITGAEADPRADLYGLGVVLFEALTGTLPFGGERSEGVMYAAVHEPAPAPSSRRAGIPEWLDALVLRLLAKAPADRFADAAAVIEALQAHTAPGQGSRVQHARIGELSAVTTPVRANAVLLAAFTVADDPAATTFARGLAEAMPAALATLGGIEIVAGDGRAGAEPEAVREQARRHGARHAVAGSIRVAGRQVRVAWTVTDALNGTVAAGDTVTGDLDAPFEIEDRVLQGVRAALRNVAGAREGGGTAARDPEVQRTYLAALARLEHRDSEKAMDEAIAGLEWVRERSGGTASVHAALARAWLCKYRLGSDRASAVHAADACRQALELDPHAADVFVTLGDLHQATGRHEEAIAAYRQALDLRVEHADAWSGLALATLSAGRFDEAEDASRRLIALRPQHWLGFSRLGHVFYRRGDYAQAIEPWKEVTRLAPDNPLGHANLASAYLAGNRLEDALASFRRAAALEPTVSAHAGLGSALYYLGRFAESAAAFEEAVRLKPKDPIVWGNLANSCDELPNGVARAAEARDRAIALMLARIEINPHEAESWLRLGQWRADRAQPGEAREALERALALAPDDGSVRAAAGASIELLGDRDRALAEIETALRLGYRIELLDAVPALAALREDPRYQALRAREAGRAGQP